MPARFARGFAVVVIVVVFAAVGGCQSSGGKGSGAGGSGMSMSGVNNSGNTQKQIAALLDQYTQALLKKDTAALDRIWADDLTFVNMRGELLSKQNRMENIKTGATAFKTIKLSEVRVRPYGAGSSGAAAAVATFQVALEAQYSGQEGSGNYRVTTAWARPKGEWQMVAVHMTRIG